MSVSDDRQAVLAALRPVTATRDAWQSQNRDEGVRGLLERAATEPDPAAVAQPVRSQPPVSVRRRLTMAGAMVAVLAAAASVSALRAQSSYAATPALLQFVSVAGQQGPATILNDLADRARQQPAPPGHGSYQYIHSKGWYLHTSADGDNHVLSSGTAEIDRQVWQAPDGSGRLVRHSPDRLAVLHPDMTLPPGQTEGRLLPADATEAKVQAKYGHAATAAGWAQTFDEIWDAQIVPAGVQAQLLQALAAQPGLTVQGETTDRAGRKGIAVSAETDQSPRERIILVFREDTGALLDVEHVILQDSELPVQPPATISYTVYLSTGYTTSTSTQP